MNHGKGLSLTVSQWIPKAGGWCAAHRHETGLPLLFWELLKVAEFLTLTRIIRNRNGKGDQVKATNCTKCL